MRLKLGNWLDLSLREPAPPLVEVGATGTSIFAGQLFDEEYNSDLKGDKANKVYDRMRRSDGQVKAALLACKLPLLVARWDIAPASTSVEDVKIAETVKRSLFDDMTITWDRFLSTALLMLDFGHSPFEKVWELRDDPDWPMPIYAWKRLAPRLPMSVVRWFFTPDNELDYIEQLASKDDQYQTIDIPAKKLVIFTHEMEGDNYKGMSLLRAAYKHWWFKNTFYAIDGIAAERHGAGLPYFSYPDNATQAQKDAIASVGQKLHTHERGYIALPESVKFQLLGVQGQLHDTKGSIEHHDVMIVRSVLAQFINVGAKEVGSYALSNDQSRFFLFSLQAVAKNFRDTMNRDVIPEMVDYNWDVHGRYPKMTVSGLDNPELAAYAQAMGTLASTGMITPDADTEAELRQTLKLPQKMAAAPRPIEVSPDLPQDAPPVPDAPEQQAGEVGRFWRDPAGAELSMSLDEIDDRLKSAEAQFIEAVKPIQARQIASVVKTITGYIEDKQFDRLTEIDIPFRDKVADAIDGLLNELLDFGKEKVREERTKQGGSIAAQEDDEEIEKPEADVFVRIRALAIASLLANRLRSAMSWEALRQVRLGTLSPDGLALTLTNLSDRELQKTAQSVTTEAFNIGRQEQAQEDADSIDRVMSSAILDANTDDYCRNLDGQEWPFGEQPPAPPYEDCEGKDKCRCVHVYIYKGEV